MRRPLPAAFLAPGAPPSVAVAFGGYFLISAGCGNEVLTQIVSPNGSYKAVVFQRDCGATTGFSTQVSIVNKHSELGNSTGNVFVADTGHGSAPSGPGGGPVVAVQWRTPDHLVISHHGAARVFKARSHTHGIEVRYESLAQ